MAKKTHVSKLDWCQRQNLIVLSFIMLKNQLVVKKQKLKLSAKKYNPATRKHETFVEKKLPPHSK